MKTKIGVQITPDDNVVTVVEEVAPGDVVTYATPGGQATVTARSAIPFGHKIALHDLPLGEKILKYREVIGTSSQAIGQGEHVHIHNIQSGVQGGLHRGRTPET